MKKEILGNVELELKEINTLDTESNVEESRQTISGSLSSIICC